MKELLTKRNLVYVLGILMGRAVLSGLGVVGIGYFGAVYLDKKSRTFIPIAVALGLFTKLPLIDAIKYSIVMIVISILTTFLEYNKVRISPNITGILSGVITILITIASGLLDVTSSYFYMIAIGEGIVIFAFTVIFRKGIEAFLHGKGGQTFSNEQVISLAILFALCMYGMPSLSRFGISLPMTVSFFAILAVGFIYGAGYGSLVGAVSGIILALQSGQVSDIGLYCMMGIIAGTFREFGRIITSTIYMIGIILLGEFFGNSRIDISGIAALLSSVTVFVLIPRRYMIRDRKVLKSDNEEDVFVKQNIQTVARGKLRDFSDSFMNLSNTFYTLSSRKGNLDSKDKNEIFNELSEGLCKNCLNCHLCWNSYFYETYQSANLILDIVENNGTITLEEVPKTFASRCISLDYYISETRRIIDIAKVNLYWHNKMAESREIIAGQLNEVASIINDFSLDLYKTIDISETRKRQMLYQLSSNNIEAKKIAIFEKRNGKQEIYLTCKMEKGTCITTKEAALYVGEVVGKRVRPVDTCKKVISKDFDTFIFVEDVNYKILTGMSRMAKDGERISGDNFSFIYPEPETMVMTLSDGMGSGEDAYEESESVVELLEKFIEAGFKKESAIKLINSILILKSGEQTFSTIDMSVINLYSGNCDFMKIGASSTFIKNREMVEVINSTSLPVGVIEQVEYDVISRNLEEDTYIIMVTDGVIDCIKGEEKEMVLAEYISMLSIKNPNDIANSVLNYALESNELIPRDDMTVLVAGFWKK
jgi:stage II sporulation protein E